MSLASQIRHLRSERCSVEEIAAWLAVGNSYVRHVLREWGMMRATVGSYPDTVAKRRFADGLR